MTEQTPLLVELPDRLSDETIATLIESLYALAGALENRYFAELHRYYQETDANFNDLPF
jgi:hypothetical protein